MAQAQAGWHKHWGPAQDRVAAWGEIQCWVLERGPAFHAHMQPLHQRPAWERAKGDLAWAGMLGCPTGVIGAASPDPALAEGAAPAPLLCGSCVGASSSAPSTMTQGTMLTTTKHLPGRPDKRARAPQRLSRCPLAPEQPRFSPSLWGLLVATAGSGHISPFPRPASGGRAGQGQSPVPRSPRCRAQAPHPPARCHPSRDPCPPHPASGSATGQHAGGHPVPGPRQRARTAGRASLSPTPPEWGL